MQQPNEIDPILNGEEYASPYDNNHSKRKLVHNISQRLKKEDRVTGKSWRRYRRILRKL